MKLFFVLLALAAILPAGDLVFIQMSDPQFGMFSENRDFAQETINFDKAIAAANKQKPAFVVICGDLVNQAGNAEQIAEYQRIAAKLDRSIALHNVAGNHDAEPAVERALRAKMRVDPMDLHDKRNDILRIAMSHGASNIRVSSLL